MTRGRFDERPDAIEATLGVAPGRITADRLYGIGRIYAALEDRRTLAVIPPLRSSRSKAAQGFPTERFKFDPHHDVVRCPAGRRLTSRDNSVTGKRHRAGRRACARCPLKAQCLPRGVSSRRVNIVTNHAAVPHAPAANARLWGEGELRHLHPPPMAGRRRAGTAKTLHGLGRAVRRGLENMKIQALLTAMAMNLKKLAAAMLLIWSFIENRPARPTPASI